MRKDVDRRAAEACAVDDARVIQLVRNDVVVATENGRDGTGIGGEAALKYQCGFRTLERREPPLELNVDRHRTGDGTDRTRADTQRPQRVHGALPEERMRSQSEIIVR